MQAIITKFLPPTTHRCARIKATCWRGSVTVSWDHELGVGANHRTAAEVLLKQFNLAYEHMVGGELPNGTGYAFIWSNQ